MTSSKSIPTNEKETLNYIDDSTDKIDEQRLSGLEEEQNTQLIKDEVLQREKKRLEAKHGNAHPEVQLAESRITYNKQLFTGLENEIEKAKIKTDPLPDNNWRVNGRVFDKNKKPIKGVTVFLSDQNKRWIELLGNSCTTELGYYSLYADEKVIDKIGREQPLYLAVSDNNKKTLYFAAAPVFIAKGLIDHKDIFINEENCTPPPVSNNQEVPPPPIPDTHEITPNAWRVKGKVTDENNKALQRLTVSLYDEDLFFADVLGTTLTNENGDFEMIYKTDAFKLLFEKRPELSIKVLDRSGKKLYTSENKVRPEAGRVEEFIIKISFKKKIG